MAQHTIYLIGAGFTGWDGFPANALEIIGKADILIGHQRHLAIFPDFAGERRDLGELPELIDFLKKTDQRVVLLASGDPTFSVFPVSCYATFPKIASRYSPM